ncbi:hypothetical protein [Neptuniibacter sp. QD37_11]|uniref:hypothetical protein n=1 Tax=Neptuniibacter sp. QD37_11 TaxID=3398209 RepID=UPI0039F4C91A
MKFKIHGPAPSLIEIEDARKEHNDLSRQSIQHAHIWFLIGTLLTLGIIHYQWLGLGVLHLDSHLGIMTEIFNRTLFLIMLGVLTACLVAEEINQRKKTPLYSLALIFLAAGTGAILLINSNQSLQMMLSTLASVLLTVVCSVQFGSATRKANHYKSIYNSLLKAPDASCLELAPLMSIEDVAKYRDQVVGHGRYFMNFEVSGILNETNTSFSLVHRLRNAQETVYGANFKSSDLSE